MYTSSWRFLCRPSLHQIDVVANQNLQLMTRENEFCLF